MSTVQLNSLFRINIYCCCSCLKAHSAIFSSCMAHWATGSLVLECVSLPIMTHATHCYQNS